MLYIMENVKKDSYLFSYTHVMWLTRRFKSKATQLFIQKDVLLWGSTGDFSAKASYNDAI